eukprot:CAMPEP_0185017966 /NCGR_PEP_ID=MMETSP1103-20130426/807_1 /TAXON_ID=36769 /ORGANISM="Paraphysomonas bandaiensis, Strain Caron Lab Isolate" /LENGTH=644 /DNA_ID=CAMNT_0027547597 /DNA_START=58 /DNA_END=1992 /DNA_ORIENTATION=-
MILPICVATLLSFASLASAGNCTNTNATCLDVALYDFYGDGWDGVEVYLETPDDLKSDAPNCINRTVEREICTDVEGQYYFTAIHENASYTPKNSWEIFWTVSNTDCNGNTTYYSGGYNTTMVWEYEDGEWDLVYWENLWENEKSCDACGDAKQCKKKPKKKNKKKGKKGPVKGKDDDSKGKDDDSKGKDDDSKGKDDDKKGKDDDKKGKDDDTKGKDDDTKGKDDDTKGKDDDTKGKDDDTKGKDDDTDTGTNTTSTTYSTTNTTSTSKTGKRYGPPAVDLRITMYDQEGDGWWQNNYLGSSWYLADDTRTELFYTGTLCDGEDGYCNICLGDGSYTIRFSGEPGNFTAWDFCGVTGGHAMELTFHVKKGKCYADSLTTLDTTCFGEVNSTVTLTGVIALGGITTEVFDLSDSKVLVRSLARMVDGWSPDRMNVVSTILDSVAFSEDSRRLSSFTHDVTFEVSFESERAYHVDGRDYALLNQLVEKLASELEEKISSGDLLTALSTRATLANVVPLTQVTDIQLLSLEVESVTYSGSEKMVASDLVYNPTSEEESQSKFSSHFDYTTIILFFSAVGVGFIAFVGIVSNTITGYSSLPMDSAHGIDRSTSAAEVVGIEMDSTISNPLGRNAAEEADTGRVASTL